MKLIDCTLLVTLLLCNEGAKGQPKGLQNWYTKELEELMISGQYWNKPTESVEKIRRKLIRGSDFISYEIDLDKCPQRLRHIISRRMNCRRVAHKFETQLLSVQIYYSMIANEQSWERIRVSGNCNELSGEILALCEATLAGRSTRAHRYIKADVNEEINRCYIEEIGNLSKYLTKRYSNMYSHDYRCVSSTYFQEVV